MLPFRDIYYGLSKGRRDYTHTVVNAIWTEPSRIHNINLSAHPQYRN